MSIRPFYDWYLDGGWLWGIVGIAVIGGIATLIALIKGEK